MIQNKPHNKAREPSQQAIGVMDSGVGGISVLKHMHALLPQESLYYLADSLYAPYGNQSSLEIQVRCMKAAAFLLEKKVKALVVACNTATAAAIDHLRAHINLPIIGMEPAVKPAAAATKNGVIGVLATTGTLKSAQFAALLDCYGQDIHVVTQACVGLVECIERGELTSEATFALVKHYCQPLLEAGADTIVLGCTHYPFIQPLIVRVLQDAGVADKVQLIDTGAAVAKQCQRRLAEKNLLKQSQFLISEDIHFWTNSQHPHALDVIQTLWGAPTRAHIDYQDF